jgi:DNA-binding SARP family transcriptional activator
LDSEKPARNDATGPAGRHEKARPRRAARICVHLLGGFRLVVDGLPVELTPVTERLVAILGLQGRSARSRVAGMLWPETAEMRALASLRTGIWRVNTAASGLIVSTRSALTLTDGATVDVRTYQSSAAQRMRAAEDVCGSGAIDYEGDLLPDWDEEWLLAERERLRQLRLHLLEQEAGRLARAGQFGLALEAAYAALCADPLRESAHRAVIGIHVAEGNTSEARRAYEVCRRTMVNDLGVEPSSETRTLVAAGPE